LYLGWTALSSRRLSPRPDLKQLLALLLPLGVYAIFWAVLKNAAYVQPAGRADLTGRAMAQILSGNFHLAEAGYILQTLLASWFTPGDWGVLGLFVIGGVVWLALRRSPGQAPEARLSLASGGLCLAAVVGMYFVTSYDTNHDISWWVSTGLDRMLFPAAILLWLGVLLGLQALDHDEDRPLPASLEDDRRLGV
jgi:hypothetical protein